MTKTVKIAIEEKVIRSTLITEQNDKSGKILRDASAWIQVTLQAKVSSQKSEFDSVSSRTK